MDGQAQDTRDPRRWWALGALTLAVLAVGLDGTVLSVALPTLAGALHASESDLQWFSSGYLLVLGAAMLPVALIGDRFGRKRTMLASLALFAVGSAACAAAPSSGAFIAARALLGLAGAGVIVMALAAVTVLFDAQERPKAIGVWSAANFLALPIGPILGGWLLTHAWWGWVFLINVPVAIIGLAAAAALLPESRAPGRPRLDRLGVATSAAAIVGLTYGLIEAGQHGWGSARAIVPMLAGLAFAVAFFAWQRCLARRPGGEPLVDPRLFASRSFTWGVILAAVAVLALIGVIFTLPQYFQGVVGVDALGSGLRLLPLIGGLVAGALPAATLTHSLGAKAVVAIGFVAVAVALALGSRTSPASGEAFIATWTALLGAGMGLATATSTAAALAELPPERGAIGSAVLQALNKTAAPLGTAVLGSVLSAGYLARLHLAGLSATAASVVRGSVFGGIAVARRSGSTVLLGVVRSAFVAGMDHALLVCAGVALAGAIMAVVFLPSVSAGREPAPEMTLAGSR
jgi:MFS transporter, DHA2 family, multidrug resistance protein